jgi:ribosomal protein S18 acetylase RimI-like enzyme
MLSTKELKAVVWWLDMPLLREADEDDAEMLHEYFKILAAEPVNNTSIRRDVFEQTAEDQRDLIRHYAQAAHSALFVLDTSYEIVGMLKITGGDNPLTAHVVDLSLNVHPDYRGSGFGSMLLEHALKWARSRETIRRVQLEVATHNEGAFRLYSRFGFQLEGTRRDGYYVYDECNPHYVDSYIMSMLL